ncbi:hemerythrin domain-containing protein [Streptomyces bullii]|uniref:Hemerythrin domain-containing protein n=1 Tax=Streptomyces bullii TaxID=349910 RepID=A0ABW0UX89_9ACTN
MTPTIAEQSAADLGGEGSILLRQRRDHAELDRLMNAYLAADTTETSDTTDAIDSYRERLWQDIVQLVFSHAFAEETVLWPVLRRVSPAGEDLTARVEEEHQAINDLLAQVEKADPDDPRRRAWIEDAFTLVRQDIRDEEDELLPRLRDALGDRQLRRLGAAWEAVRRTAPTRPHPAVPRRPPGNAVLGVALSGFDRLRDLARARGPSARRAGLSAGVPVVAAGAAVLVWRAVVRRGTRCRRVAARPGSKR